MKGQKIPEDVSKDFKQAQVQVGHKMCIKKRRVTKVQQSVVKKMSATICQTMEVEESCAIVKRKKVSVSLGPNKHYVPHVSLSKKKTATCHQTKVSSSYTGKTSRKSPKQVVMALDKLVVEKSSSVGKSPLETSPGCSESASQEKMGSPKNLSPNKSVLEKSQGKRGRKKKVLPSSSSSNAAAQNTSCSLSPSYSSQSQTVSTQHTKPNKNVMLLRSNEKTSSPLRGRRRRTVQMHPETLPNVQEGVGGASVESVEETLLTHQPTMCSPSDVLVDDKCLSNPSDSFNEDDSSQETNTSLIVQLSPIKFNLLARQASSPSHKSSSELSMINSNEHGEETCVLSDPGCTCNCSSTTKLVGETKTAKRKYGSRRRKRVKSSEMKNESYSRVWGASTHQEQSTIWSPRHYRNQEINVRKAKSVGKTTTLLRPNETVTSDGGKKTDQHANVENNTRIVVVGPNKRCIPVFSKRKEKPQSACSCIGLHTCHPQDNIPPEATQQNCSALAGVNSTTKWISTISTPVDNGASTLDTSVVNQKTTTSCTETLTTGDKPCTVKSAKRLSSPPSTQTKTESPGTRKSPQVPTPKCQIINEKEVQVTSPPESLTVEGLQTKSLIQNEVSVTLNKLCYESVTHRLQGDDYGYRESEASTLSVPQHCGRNREHLRSREATETRTALKSDGKRGVSGTRGIVFNSAGLSTTQNTAITSSTQCQSNINSTSAIQTKPRRNSLLQKTSLHSKDTNNDKAKGKSSTLSKKRNAKDLSERIQNDSIPKSLNTRVSDELEQFTVPDSRGVQMPPILQDQDNLKTICQAASDYSPKIVMGLRPYARYRSNGGKNQLPSYNSKHWLLVQGQIDSEEERAQLVNDAPVRLKGKRVRKRKKGRKNTGSQQKENEANPNQSVPIVQDDVAAETHSCVTLEASSIEPPKQAVRTCKDLQEKNTDLTQEKKCHESKVTCQTIQSGLQKDMNNLKDSFCEVDSGADETAVVIERDEKPTPIRASHETSSSESEAVAQTTSNVQVSREKGNNPNPIISQTQTLNENSVSHELDSRLSPVITEHETQTSDCKVVAEADGTLSLIISSSETPSPDVEVVAQSTLVQVYVPVQSRHGRSPPSIISPHHAESRSSDEGTLSEHETCSTYIISPRTSLTPENKGVTQTTSGDVSTQQDGSFSNITTPLETEDPDNELETQDTDLEVQIDKEGFPQGIDLIQSTTRPASEAIMQSIPVDIETQSSSIDIRLNKEEDVTPKERSLYETHNPDIEEQESSSPNCDTGIEAADDSDQLEQDDRPIHIVCEQESSIPDCETGIETVDTSDQLEQDDRPIHIVCKQESSISGGDMGIETVDTSDQLEQDDRPIHIVCEQESSIPVGDTGIETVDTSDQLEQDDSPIQIVCERESSIPDGDTGIEIADDSDQLEQDDRPIHIVCEQESSIPDCEMGIETADDSDQLEQDDRPIHIVCEHELSISDGDTGRKTVDISDQLEEKTKPTLTEDVKKSFNFKQLWNIKRVPKKEGQKIAYFYEKVDEEEVDETQSVVLELKQPSSSQSLDSVQSYYSEAASHDSGCGPETVMIPQKPQPVTDLFTSIDDPQLHNTETSHQLSTPTTCDEATCVSTQDQLSSQPSQQILTEELFPEEPQLTYEKDTNHEGENSNEPKSISLDNAALMMKENETELSKEINAVQQASSLSNSDANRNPEGLSTQNEMRKVTESSVTFHPSQRENRSCLSIFGRPKQITMKFQHSKGCRFEKQTSSLELETPVDALQFSLEESSSSEKILPDVSSESSASLLHTNPEGQEFTPMFDGSISGEVSTTEINDETSAVELDSVMVDTQFTTSLEGNHSENVEMSKETGNVSRVRKTKSWRSPLLDSMTLRKKDEHFLFSRLGFKKSKQRKSQMSERRKYMAIKRELSQIPVEDCVKSEPLFRAENQHQECLHQSNSIVPEITDQAYHQRNHTFTSTSTRKSISECPQTSPRLGKRNLIASKTLNSEDYIFPAKRTKRPQLSLIPLTGSVLTNNLGRSKFGISIPHHLLVPKKIGRPKKLSRQDPAPSESTVVSDITEQTQVLNHPVGNEEIFREILRQDDTEARGVDLIDSSVSLLSGQGTQGGSKETSYGHCSQSDETPDNHVNNPKLEQDVCDQSLLPFEPQKKGYRRKILNQGNKHQSFDTATTKPKKRGRPKKNTPSSFKELHQHESPMGGTTGKQTEEDSSKPNSSLGKRNHLVNPKVRKSVVCKRMKQKSASTAFKLTKTSSLLKASVKKVPPKGWYWRMNVLVPKKRGRPHKVKIESQEMPANTKQPLDPHIGDLCATKETEAERVLACKDSPLNLPKKIGRPKKSPLSVSQETQQVTKVNLHVLEETPGRANKSQEPKPKRKYCRKTNSFSGIKSNQQSQELKPKRKYCRKTNSFSGTESNQQSQELKPKRKYCRKMNSSSGIERNQQAQEPKPKRKYCRKMISLSGMERNQQGQELKPKRKYCRKMISLSGMESNQQSQELKPKRKYCRKMNSLIGIESNQQGQELKPKRKYCRKMNSISGIERNQQGQELKPKRKYCRKMTSLSGIERNQQGQEPKPKRKYCRKTNSLSVIKRNQLSQKLKPKRKYCRKMISVSGIESNQQSQELKSKRKYCRKTNSLSGIERNQQSQEPKPKRKYCRKMISLSGIESNQQSLELKPKRKYCRKMNSLSGIETNQQSQEPKPKRKYCRKMNSLSGIESNQQSQEPKPKRKYCRKMNSISGIERNQQSQEPKPKRKYCRKTNSLIGIARNQQSQEPKPKRKYCRKMIPVSGIESNQQSQEPKPKRKYCRKMNSLSGIARNQQSQEPKPKRKYCRKMNSLSGIESNQQSQEPKPKRKYCRKTNSLIGIARNQQSQEPKPKRKYCRKMIPVSGIARNQQSQEPKPKRKYCRKMNSLSGIESNQQSQEPKPKRKYCRKMNSLSGIESNQQSQEPKPKRKYCRKTNSLIGIARNQQSQEPKPKRKYCRKMISVSGIARNQQSQEPKPKRKYCRKTNSLSGIESNQQGQELKPKRKYCRKMISLSGNERDQQSQELKPKRKYCRKVNSSSGFKWTMVNKKNLLGQIQKSTKQKVTHKKMGRPRKISLSGNKATLTYLENIQTMNPNVNKKNFLKEIGSLNDTTSRPKKIGRPKKISLIEMKAPPTPTEQHQPLQPEIIEGNFLGEFGEPTTRPKKMGRPKKISQIEMKAPSTPTEQLQPEIIQGNFLGEYGEPTTRPKKMGRPRKMNTSVSGSKATLSTTDQVQLTHKIRGLIPGYVGPAKDEEFILEEFCSLESLEEAVQCAAMELKTHQGNRISRKRKNTTSLSHLTTTSAASKRRAKRSSRSPEGSYWDCSVCTYRNKAEAFKCAMCDVRKGTSTRKPRLNAQLVAQQQAQQNLSPLIHVKTSKTTARSPAQRKAGTSKKPRPRLKNVDRSSAISTEVVVNNVPVIITEYKEKSHTRTTIDSDDASAERTNGNVNGL